MNKIMTMQEILNNKELLNILYTFREEEEIKEFCKENSIDISPTVLFNLKKTLGNQIEQFENAGEPLKLESLKDVAGGKTAYGDTDDYLYYAGLDNVTHVFQSLLEIGQDVGLNLAFHYGAMKMTKMNQFGNISADVGVRSN